METAYALRAVLTGHSKDVRALTVTLDGCILSASRDKTAKLWRPDGIGFADVMTYSGHQGFVSAIGVMLPTTTYPEGLVFTGSNDHLIRGYKPLFPEPVFVLKGHSDTVCALTVGQNFLISGSWDKTAKVWQGDECVATLSGHAAAVWCVALISSGSSLTDVCGLTGSADKTIVLWQGTQIARKFLGHTDCVRALAVLSPKEFLSAANDASIRRWLITGECSQVFYGHTNYVYGLTVLADGRHFASSGEDRSIRLWSLEGNTDCLQTIHLPSQSVWALASLPNNDLVSGSSDGVIRVFTADPALKTSADIQKAFQEELASTTLAAQQELGGVKVSELPGPESLYEPGKREGQTKLVRQGTLVTCYSWSTAQSEWVKIGDVVGAATEGDADKTGAKTMHMGQAYDYVFSVDIEEGKPHLKLPYNIGDDPYTAAQKFIHQHDLSQHFLDEIANFIIKNIPSTQLNAANASTGSYADPFTGGNRYVPGSSGPAPPSSQTVPGADPFTGGGRYVPAGTVVPMSTETQSIRYFPIQTCLRFDQANVDAILGKIMEFNERVSPDVRVMAEVIPSLASLAREGDTFDQLAIQTLKTLMEWPPEFLFPVLDLLRLALRQQKLFQAISGHTQIYPYLAPFISASPLPVPPNILLALRMLANLCLHKSGQDVIRQNCDSLLVGVLGTLKALPESTPAPQVKNIQVAAATLVLNTVILLFGEKAKKDDLALELKSKTVNVLVEILELAKDGEAQFRALVGLGTLLQEDEEAVALAQSIDAKRIVQELTSVVEPVKVSECAKQVKALLS